MFTRLKTYFSLYFKSFRLFWRAAKGSSLLLLFLVPIQALAPAGLIWLAQRLLDALVAKQAVVPLLVAWGLVFLVASAAIPVNTSIQGILTDKLIAFVNVELMHKSESIQGLGAFEDADFYDNLQLVSSEASWRPVNLIVFGISAVREVITTASMMLLLAHYNPWIALVLLAAIIPQSVVSYHVQQDAFETMVTRSPDARKLQYYSEALLTARDAKEVRLFGAFTYFIDAYKHLYGKMHASVKHVRLRQMRIAILFLVVSVLLSTFSLLWMINAIQQGHAGIGGLLVFASTLTATSGSIYSLIENSSLLYDTLLYMQKYFGFMNYQDEQLAIGDAPFPEQVTDISLDHVSFSYPNQKVPALDDVSLTVHGGEKIAVVGENGSGKTTMAKLLMRFYNPRSGQVQLNNADVRTYNVADYRRHFGAVFQDFSKFLLPLGASVGIGNPALMHDDAAVQAALEAGGMAQVMTAKQLTATTPLGKQYKGGIDLSGGEWQKMAIARAFMPTSAVMILDEPTAALDPRSEYDVYQRFLTLAAGKTVFFITHRLAAVQMADRVLVMRGGHVVGFGTHQELLKSSPYYKELYDMQASGYTQDD
jgi:ATP-binding cassette subfamily B protein